MNITPFAFNLRNACILLDAADKHNLVAAIEANEAAMFAASISGRLGDIEKIKNESAVTFESAKICDWAGIA